MNSSPQVLAKLLLKIEASAELKNKLLEHSESNAEAESEASSLFEELQSYLTVLPMSPSSTPVKIYVAACIDMTHSGHFNMMRQARALGDYLIFGVISDEEIRRSKGPPVMSEDERAAMAEACKWVDEVIKGVEYYVTPEILARVGADYVAHGDDLAINKATGKDAYEDVRNSGQLKVIKRTEGISTTEMVGRMLLMTQGPTSDTSASSATPATPVTQVVNNSDSSFLASTRRINQFSTHKKPSSTDRIVYIDGSFDLIHKGHVSSIRKAKELGDYLIVGIHSDTVTNKHKGLNYPIMNLHERTLNVLALKYVDDVIMGAPWMITEDMIRSLNIHVVVAGSNAKNCYDLNPDGDPYEVPKRLGIFTEIESECSLNAEDIVQRIVENRLGYMNRNQTLVAKEEAYYKNKQFVQEL